MCVCLLMGEEIRVISDVCVCVCVSVCVCTWGRDCGFWGGTVGPMRHCALLRVQLCGPLVRGGGLLFHHHGQVGGGGGAGLWRLRAGMGDSSVGHGGEQCRHLWICWS